MAMGILTNSALPIATEMINHDDALLGSPEFVHFQLASGLGRKRHDPAPITVLYMAALHNALLEQRLFCTV